MQDPFQQKKQSILKEILSNSPENVDASPKGTIDEYCIPIINLINSHENMVTTSSCSGRVSVYLEGTAPDRVVAKGNEGRWIFVTHDPKELPGWYNTVDFKYISPTSTSASLASSSSSSSHGQRGILFKYEALILHVKCRDLETANKLYAIAMSCGFRESGVGSGLNVAIRISIKLDIPIGYMDDLDSLCCIVSKEYLEYITQLSLDRFQENFRKLNQLYAAIEIFIHESGLNVQADKDKNDENQKFKEKHRSGKNLDWESKEARRERMMREGLERKKQKEELRKLAELSATAIKDEAGQEENKEEELQ